MTAALQGVRVLELCEVFQGPVAAQTLADLGADVIDVDIALPDLDDVYRHYSAATDEGTAR